MKRPDYSNPIETLRYEVSIAHRVIIFQAIIYPALGLMIAILIMNLFGG